MSASRNLPSLSLSEDLWDETPPDPLAEPGYYDGLLWRRVLGYALAAVVIWGATVGLVILGILSLGLLWPILAVISVVLPLAYHTYFLGRNGATPGMAFFDVELRAWDGRRMDYMQAFLQTALFYATVPLTSGLVLLVSLFNDRRRTLHDILSGSIAVRHGYLSAAAAS